MEKEDSMRQFWCPKDEAHDIRVSVNVIPDVTITTVYCRDCDDFVARVTERRITGRPTQPSAGWFLVHGDGDTWWEEDSLAFLEACPCGRDGNHYRVRAGAFPG